MNIIVSTEEGGSRGLSSSERHSSVETVPFRGAASRFKFFRAKHRRHLRSLCRGEVNRVICCTTPTADQNKEDGNRFAPSAFKPLRRFGTMRWSTPIRLRRTASGEPDASGAQLKRWQQMNASIVTARSDRLSKCFCFRLVTIKPIIALFFFCPFNFWQTFVVLKKIIDMFQYVDMNRLD